MEAVLKMGQHVTSLDGVLACLGKCSPIALFRNRANSIEGSILNKTPKCHHLRYQVRRFLIKFMLLPLASPHKTPGMIARRDGG